MFLVLVLAEDGDDDDSGSDDSGSDEGKPTWTVIFSILIIFNLDLKLFSYVSNFSNVQKNIARPNQLTLTDNQNYCFDEST